MKTSKSGVRLAYRRGYYALQPADKKTAENDLQNATCRDLLNATAVVIAAKQYAGDRPGKAKYLMMINPAKLTFSPEVGGVRGLSLRTSVCTFDKSRKPLQFFEEAIQPTLTDQQYSLVQQNGYPRYVQLDPTPGVVTVRLLVQDVATGASGSIDIPYSETVAGEAAPATPSARPAPATQTTH